MNENLGEMTLHFGTAGCCELCAESIDESKYSDYESMYAVACLDCRRVLEQGEAEAVRLVEGQLERQLGDRTIEIRF